MEKNLLFKDKNYKRDKQWLKNKPKKNTLSQTKNKYHTITAKFHKEFLVLCIK